jgi:hypothetical protein
LARAVDAACPALTVRAVPGGWTVATRTGRTTVCRTLGALVDAVAAEVAAPVGGGGPDQEMPEAVRAVRSMIAVRATSRAVAPA